MPDYLRNTRKTAASILWIPLSWLVQVLVFAIVAMIVTAIVGFRGSLELTTALLLIGLLPVIGIVAAAVAALVIVRPYRGPGASSFSLFLRAFFWFFSLPARGWLIGFGWALKFMLLFAVAVIIGIICLLITLWAVTTLINMGANGWLVVGVGLALPLLTVGGATWANQYGSGTTGGMPIGCVFIAALGIVGGFLWFCLLLVVLALFALPASLVLISFRGGYVGSLEWDWYEWAIAIGTFVVMVVPPLIVEGMSTITDFGRSLADRTPYFGRRRRAKRTLDAALEEARSRRAGNPQAPTARPGG